MKILILLSNPSIGGTETFLASVIPCWIKLGLSVDLINLWQDSDVEKLTRDIRFNYKEISNSSRRISINDFRLLIKEIKANNYDIVVGFGIRVSILLRFIKPFIDIPVVIGLRGLDEWRKWYHVWPDKLTEFGCDMFIPNSDAVAKLRRSREKTPLNKMVVIKNGVDINYYDKTKCLKVGRSHFGIPEDKLIVVTVGNLRVQKGHNFLLNVILNYKEQFENVHFVWAGEGPLRSELEKKIYDAGLNSKITLLGTVSNIRSLLACSDILAMPSKEEGMPRCVLEAMSMSLPCVATDVGGTVEIIENDVNGFFSGFGDVTSFGYNLKKLVDSKELREEIGEAARECVVSKFNIFVIAQQYQKLFDSLCKGERNGFKLQNDIVSN